MYKIFKMKNELLNKDIENIEELIKGAKDFEQYEGNKYYKSMENILHINKNLQNKVKELENTINKISESSSNNERLIEKLNSGEVFTPNQLDFIKQNNIPKQKIKNKIEELKCEKNKRKQLGIFILKDYENQYLLGEISSLEELLEESEDK